MKKLYLIGMLVLFFIQGHSQKSYLHPGSYKTSKVIIYREKSAVWNSRTTYVEMNNEPLINMINGSYASYEVRPMLYSFRLAVNPPSEDKEFFETDQTYYLRVKILEDAGQVIPTLQFVHPDTARNYLDNHRLIKLAKKNLVKDSVNKACMQMNVNGTDILALSIDMGSGFGFQNHPMVTMTNGDTAFISAGGGSVFGVSTIYRFTPYFDVEGGIQSQNSTLTPVLSNAEVTFDRLAFSIGPRFTAKIARRWRVNLGPGVVNFVGIKMTTDFTKLPNGYKGVYKYKSSTGFYGMAESEYFFKRWSFAFGFKYSTNTYELKSASIDGVSVPLNNPGLDDVRKYDGSGLFMTFNFRYHL